ncbi:MAG TPA: hypothetical protein VF143_09855 [Candidatus Nanopelagicales bacterium]
MEFLYDALVVLHFIGLASLLGGFLVQLSSSPRVVNPAMLHGAFTQLITGIALVGMRESGIVEDEDALNMTKIGIKLLILLVITGLVWFNRKKESISTGLWAAIGGLTIANIVIAVFV